VPHAWLVKPPIALSRLLRLREGLWTIVGVWEDAAVVRAEPFEAIELSLAELWPDEAPALPSRRGLTAVCSGLLPGRVGPPALLGPVPVSGACSTCGSACRCRRGTDARVGDGLAGGPDPEPPAPRTVFRRREERRVLPEPLVELREEAVGRAAVRRIHPSRIMARMTVFAGPKSLGSRASRRKASRQTGDAGASGAERPRLSLPLAASHSRSASRCRGTSSRSSSGALPRVG